jgi:hypothetical protein
LLGGILLLLLALSLGMQQTSAAESSGQLHPIVGQHNRIAHPSLTARPGAAIRMPQLATTAPILGSANAIQQPNLAIAKSPILGSTNAIQQPVLAIAKSPILGSANAIQQPALAVAKAPILGSANAIQQPALALGSLTVQVQAVRLPILTNTNGIVQPALDTSLDATTPTLLTLPVTGSGIATTDHLPNLLVLLLAGLAVCAFGLAIRLQHRLVDPDGQLHPHRPHQTAIHPVHPLHRYGGEPIA